MQRDLRFKDFVVGLLTGTLAHCCVMTVHPFPVVYFHTDRWWIASCRAKCERAILAVVVSCFSRTDAYAFCPRSRIKSISPIVRDQDFDDCRTCQNPYTVNEVNVEGGSGGSHLERGL